MSSVLSFLTWFAIFLVLGMTSGYWLKLGRFWYYMTLTKFYLNLLTGPLCHSIASLLPGRRFLLTPEDRKGWEFKLYTRPLTPQGEKHLLLRMKSRLLVQSPLTVSCRPSLCHCAVVKTLILLWVPCFHPRKQGGWSPGSSLDLLWHHPGKGLKY